MTKSNFDCYRCVHRYVCPAYNAKLTFCNNYLVLVRCCECTHFHYPIQGVGWCDYWEGARSMDKFCSEGKPRGF